MGALLAAAWPLLLALLTLGFAAYALDFGWRGSTGTLRDASRITSPVAAANAGIFLHMMSGALITALAPLQLLAPVRRRFPAVHRWSGRVLVGLALLTALGGLIYITLHGTVGGADMSLSFALYGVLMITSAVQALRHARARRWALHADWALRLFVLCIASWIYRVHYGLWSVVAGSWGTSGLTFEGPFDLWNIWAFYLLYLALLELWLHRKGRGLFRKGSCQ